MFNIVEVELYDSLFFVCRLFSSFSASASLLLEIRDFNLWYSKTLRIYLYTYTLW